MCWTAGVCMELRGTHTLKSGILQAGFRPLRCRTFCSIARYLFIWPTAWSGKKCDRVTGLSRDGIVILKAGTVKFGHPMRGNVHIVRIYWSEQINILNEWDFELRHAILIFSKKSVLAISYCLYEKACRVGHKNWLIFCVGVSNLPTYYLKWLGRTMRFARKKL